MSGIVGLVHTEERRVDAILLRQLTDALAFRGPDGRQVWTSGAAGLGHAMLRTTDESFHETQPCSLDGRVWITADARIDGRVDLMRRLGLRPQSFHPITDPELILHAYEAWGEACVEHLLGDFAFAIWDEPQRRLFCARDHFGVKPFYYARVGAGLIISNTLNCVRLHPAVSDRLNEQAIGDFLLIGSNEEPGTTAFADIGRLPAAHTLTWTEGELRVRRYWTLPIKDEIYYRRERDYVEHFRELLDVSIGDRLRTEKIGVFMSGGMDSTTVAAAACDLLTRRAEPFDLRAYTVVYDRLFNDPERYYSQLAADYIGIPIHYHVADDYELYQHCDAPEMSTPEPYHEPLYAMSWDHYRAVAIHGRAALTGDGGDAILRGSPSYLVSLIRQGGLGRITVEVAKYLLTQGHLPEIGLRSRIRRWTNRTRWQPEWPSWLNRSFEKRLNLSDRFATLCHEGAYIHPRRPEAYNILSASNWASGFEYCDPGVTSSLVEIRHPLLDLRLIDYCLALPTLPVCVHKNLMRKAMDGLLPEPVRTRRKQVLAGDPVIAKLGEKKFYADEMLTLCPLLFDWVDQPSLLASTNGDSDPYWSFLRPLSLSYWLRQNLLPAEKVGMETQELLAVRRPAMK